MKTLKFILCSGLISLFMMTSVMAQGVKANFSGTWAFNETKSKLPEGGFRMSADKLVVTQDAATLSVEQTSQRGTTTMKYTLDGKESVNATGFGTTNRTSTAVWSADGKTLTISSVMVFDRNGTKTEFKSVDVWTLTPENALSIETSSTSTMGDTKSTALYDKK